VISTYRRVLGLPGALAFSMTGILARLSESMITLGLVVLISSRTGSYGLAGSVSAAYLLAYALAAVFLARLVDQLGQALVLGVGTGLSMAALAMVAVAVELDWRTPLPHLFAALSGGTVPAVGSAVRARWTNLVHDKELLQTAFAFEAVADEIVYLVGPSLVTLLATLVDPVAGVVTAIAVTCVGITAFVSQRSTEPPPSGRARRNTREPMGWVALAPVAVCSICLGFLFGGGEVATVAFAEELGHKTLSGFVLGTWSLGSLLAGLLSGLVTWRSAPAVRMRRAILMLALLLCPTPFIHSFPLMFGCMFLAGWAISPALIAAVSLTEQVVPPSRLNEGMAVLSTGLTAGLAPGAAAVGYVVDHHGASTSYWLPIGAGFVGAGVGYLTARWTSVSARQQESETVPVDHA
jgi:MFS family permease